MSTTTTSGTITSFSNTPQAKDDTFTASEGDAVWLDVMANDAGGAAKILWSVDESNVDGSRDLLVRDNVDSIPETSVKGAQIRVIDNRVQYDPSGLNYLAQGEVIYDSFTYAIRLANGTYSWATVTIELTGTNDAPMVTGAVKALVNEDDPLSTLNALANASDVDNGAVLSVVNVSAQDKLPAGVTYDAATKTFTLDPANGAYQSLAAGQCTTVTVNYGVSDGMVTIPTSVTWTITGTNDAPKVSGAVVGTATEDAPTSTLNALENASDVDTGAVLSVVNVPAANQLPAGVTYDAATKTFTLDPTNDAYQSLAAGKTTTVTVSYGVSDGTATTPASVTWTITGTNDAPKVTGAGTGSAIEDAATSTLSALANASDVDAGDLLSVVDVPATNQLPAGVTYDAATKSFTLDPTNVAYQSLAAGKTTTVTVSYGVSDGTATTPASVTWTITGTNDKPVATADVASGGENETLTIDVLANDTDVDTGAVLTITGGSAPTGKGTVSVVSNQLQFDPGTDFDHLPKDAVEEVTLTYTIKDEHGATSTSTVTVKVTGTNDAPKVNGAVTGNVTEDAATSTLNALANASDLDDGAKLSVVNVPANDKLPAGVTYDADTNSFTLDPTDIAYQSLGAGQKTTVTVNYGVSDGLATTGASVTWTITGTNDVPVVSGAVKGSATEDGDGSTLNALANASDVDLGHVLQVVEVPDADDLPAGVTYDAATKSFTLDPTHADYQSLADGEKATVTVHYGVSDGTATTAASVTWTVTGTNDKPTLVKALADQTSLEDEAVSFTVPEGTFADIDAGTTLVLSATLSNGQKLPGWLSFDAGTGTFTGTPPADFNGVLEVKVTASDGSLSASDTFSLTITPVNDAPALTGAAAVLAAGTEDVPYTVAASDLLKGYTDVDGDGLSVTNLTASNGSVVDNGNGTYTITPSANHNGVMTLTYSVSDGQGAATPATLSYNVAAVNDAPAGTNVILSLAEDDSRAFNAGDFGFSDTVENDQFAAVVITTLPTAGALTLNGVAVAAGQSIAAADLGGLVFTPTDDANGTGYASFTFQVRDDGGTSNGGQDTDQSANTITIDVTPVNDAPTVLAPVEDQSFDEETAWTFQVPVGTFGDLDGDALTYSATLEGGAELPGWLHFDPQSRTFSGTPPVDLVGAYSITIVASDGSMTASDTFTVTINDLPDTVVEPTANKDVIVVSTDTTVFIPAAWLLGNDTDAQGDVLSISSLKLAEGSSLPSNWQLTPVTLNGVVTGFNLKTGGSTQQSVEIEYTVSDGNGHTDTVTSLIRTPGQGGGSTNGGNTINLNGIDYNYSYIDGMGQGDTLTGGSVENSTLQGSLGNDAFVGGSGNDTLDAGGGSNLLSGGANNDDFILRHVAGMSNRITDFDAANANNTSSQAADQLIFEVGVGANPFNIGDNDDLVETGEVVISQSSFANTAAVQAFIDGRTATTGTLFAVYNAELGNAAIYYDANPSQSGGAVLVTELENITLSGMSTLNLGDFLFI